MANGHGGERTPNNPAPVSPPGSLSQRTDGGATQAPKLASGGAYGERTEMQNLQSGAPMAGTPAPPSAPSPDLRAAKASLVPLSAPSTRPDEPLQAGLGSVPGTGPTQIDDSTRERLLNALPMLAWLASQPKASEQTRQFYRQLRADL